MRGCIACPYLARVDLFAEELRALSPGSTICLDEVQRLPHLLNEFNRAPACETALSTCGLREAKCLLLRLPEGGQIEPLAEGAGRELRGLAALDDRLDEAGRPLV
jgi:hypothetical protein